MMPFALERPSLLRDALRTDAEYIAGGTDMVQLMQENVRTPKHLVDLSGVLPVGIFVGGDRARIDSGTTMEETATYAPLADAAPAVTTALLESASTQVRNLATMGGNLLQRTRCGYFRDAVVPCNKRRPGSGCSAIGGENRNFAVLGTSEQCIATHASDLAVALVALRAEIDLEGPEGARHIPLSELYRTAEDQPDIETTLRPGEVITAIEIPLDAAAARSVYVKVRDRASFEWALMSAAVGLELEGGRIVRARIAMGGVGTKPWRMDNVEGALIGCAPTRDAVAGAVALATEEARGWGHNDFKIGQMPRLLACAIELAGERV